MYGKDAEIFDILRLTSTSFLMTFNKSSGLTNNLKYHFYLFAGPGHLLGTSNPFHCVSYELLEIYFLLQTVVTFH